MSSPQTLTERIRIWVRSRISTGNGRSTLPFKVTRLVEHMFQDLIELLDSEYFPDWASEDISIRLDRNDLDYRDLIEIVHEAQEDMFDLHAVSELPIDQTGIAVTGVTNKCGLSQTAEEQILEAGKERPEKYCQSNQICRGKPSFSQCIVEGWEPGGAWANTCWRVSVALQA